MNMLKLQRVYPIERVSIEFDEYIPISIGFGTSDQSPPLYWRAGDFERSLVEVAIGEKDGAIKGVTVTSVSSRDVEHVEREPDESDTINEEGTPAFLVEWWDRDSSKNFVDRFDDDPMRTFKLVICGEKIAIKFNMLEIPVKYIRNDRARFGFSSSGDLLSIEVTNLSNAELETLKRATG